MAPGGAALRCARGHSFDVARQGYVNLTAGRAPHTGDTAAMVAARADFLAAGHYRPIAAALAAAAAAHTARPTAAPPRGLDAGREQSAAPPDGPAAAPPSDPDTAAAADPTAGPAPLVVDAGAGTGYHLAAVLDALPGALGLALDASKPALRRAARAHPRAGAALADTWSGLPLPDGAAAVLLNVFAPRNPAEFRRVLAPGGALLVVTPEPDHLAELVAALDLLTVAPDKTDRLAALPGFAVAGSTAHAAALRLSAAEVGTLVAMGPNAHHADPAGPGAVPTPFATRFSVRLTTLLRTPD
nr:23S rRNA methyltransferase [Pilimelia anulata]